MSQTTVESGESLIGAKAKLRQPSQQEGAKKADSPQFNQIGGGGWTGSRKSLLAPIRLSPDYGVVLATGVKYWDKQGGEYVCAQWCGREFTDV